MAGVPDKSQTKLTYEPKNSRLLCQLGTSKLAVYCYHILENKWVKWAFVTAPSADHITINENLDIYIIQNSSTSNIYDNNLSHNMDTNDEMGVTAQKETGWIKLADLDNTGFIRRLNIKYSATAPVGTTTAYLKIYKDGNSSPTITKTISETSDVSGKSKSFRMGIRANTVKIKLEATTSISGSSPSHQTFTCERLELELD